MEFIKSTLSSIFESLSNLQPAAFTCHPQENLEATSATFIFHLDLKEHFIISMFLVKNKDTGYSKIFCK
jgi:hypothetical protein